MSTPEIAKFLIIHIVVPILGVVMYFWLLRRMYKQGLKDPPVAGLFIIFLNYGALLVQMLTSLFWYWSGMASLGAFYLVLAAHFLWSSLHCTIGNLEIGRPITDGYSGLRLYTRYRLQESLFTAFSTAYKHSYFLFVTSAN